MNPVVLHLKYSFNDEFYDTCRKYFGLCYLDYNRVEFLLCETELSVTSLSSVGLSNNGNTWKLLLEKKLECDKKSNDIVTYIESNGINA